jgi:replicative DNA helicase
MTASDVGADAPAQLDAAEAALLGVALRDPATVATVARAVPTVAMFDAPANRSIWTAVAACGAAGGVERVLETMRRIDPAAVDAGVAARVRWLAANAPTAPLAAVVRAFERAYIARGSTRVGSVRDVAPVGGRARAPAPRERTPATPATPWDEPLSLEPDAAPPPFPPDVLPGHLGAYARGLARATQTPLDLPGMLVLAALSTASGRRFVVKTNYREPINVFAAVALPPGSRKSEVVREIVWPFDEWERDAAAAQAREPVTDPPAPKPRLYSTDATPESLTTRLAEQGGRFALLSPEGGGVFAMMTGRYTGERPNIEVYLHGHAGDKIVVDRVKRASETIWSPALTIGVAAQPDAIRALVGQSDLAARGLLARFLFALPASNIGFREVDVPPLGRDARAHYALTVRSLLALPDDHDERGRTRPWNLTLSADARRRDLDFRARTEARQRPEGDLAAMPEWGAKFAGSTLRIAGLLHLATHADDPTPWTTPIADLTLERAIFLGEEYLAPHAALAFGTMTEGVALRSARRLLEWCRRNRAQKVTPREAMRALGGRGKRAEVCDPALEVLVDHGWIRPLEIEPTGRPGRPRDVLYAVHPRVSDPGFRQHSSAIVSSDSRRSTNRKDS